MKRLILLSVIAAAGFASAAALAGRDESQMMELHRAMKAKEAKHQTVEATRGTGPAAEDRAGDTREAKEGVPGKELFKRVHPKNAYSY